MELELAKRYWELQNYITGFAMVQMASALFAVGTSADMRAGVGHRRCLVVLATLTAGALYSAAIWAAARAEAQLSPARVGPVRRILCWTLYLRIAAVLGITILGGIVFGYVG